ncbi:MAG: ADP-ribosylglycohydrolase family protein [Aulosira sp. ZfuVER01]|nr:ADP-ribosylglycohydrolase family protein [Aulosira sp. ZfuVER01]MDZ8001514.1 ADP-ribosylglycohydrolase family protein [Aulosira sp. DedVER01a]MDZ8051618.1 ADP-ribosylglycohydrolase family protein [Aulosira sp. ZfuCHP01]
MRYSLVSRFRGALLGALVGGSLASSHHKELPNCCDIDTMAVLGTESLIELGRLDLDDWQSRQQQASSNLAVTNSISLKVILATLPVALFFHENTLKLRQNLLRVLKIWEDDPVIRDGTLAVGYAIAQSLTEKLHPRTLIPEAIAFIGETPTSLPQQLLKVNALLDRGAGLERAQVDLSRGEKLSSAIAMAFYCFLITLEDYRLAVLRATQPGDVWQQDHWRLHLHNISAITGALSGAYNSTAGIPVGWQILYSQANSPASGLSNFSGVVELTDALVAVWSGLYNFAQDSSHSSAEGDSLPESEASLPLREGSRYKSGNQSHVQPPLCVYAAPRVIRSR